jgi:Uncharacterized conserved protein
MVGAKWAVDEDYGWKKDLKRIESEGSMEGDPSKVSSNAKKRGMPQLGSLGSGNHFLEMQVIDEIYDEKTSCWIWAPGRADLFYDAYRI